jgi:plastocyanin
MTSMQLTGATLWLALAASTLVASTATTVILAADTTHTVQVKDFMFSPISMKIRTGTQVTWTNHDEEPHTVSSNEGVFRSFALDTNDSFSFKFDKPGTYHYTCTIHPRMTGTIIVE